jgi:hypothetical protein
MIRLTLLNIASAKTGTLCFNKMMEQHHLGKPKLAHFSEYNLNVRTIIADYNGFRLANSCGM